MMITERSKQVGPGEQRSQQEGGGAAEVLSQVAIPPAVVLDNAPFGAGRVPRHLVVVDRPR